MRERESFLRHWTRFLFTFVVLLAADQASKAAAVRGLAQGPKVLISGVLELLYIENHGAAFGILQGAKFFFLFISLAVLLFIALIYGRIPDERKYIPFRVTLVMAAAGAAGNLMDRMMLGYVRDFIYFSLIDFPVFNVADICVTCGVALLIVLLLFYYKDDHDFDFLHAGKDQDSK